MGIDPNVAVLPFEKEISYPDADTLVQGECACCVPGTVDDETAREILCRHFVHTREGGWRATVRYSQRRGVVEAHRAAAGMSTTA